jgi:glycosyltransferase involved in cell wall biosynthesis
MVLALGRAAYGSALQYSIAEEKVLACDHIVDASRIRQAVDHARTQRYRGDRPPKGHRFLYVGQIIERKNVACLIEAFARIAEEGDELLIVGEGPNYGIIRAAAERVHVGKVRLLGYKSGDELWSLFAQGQTLVLPSTNEVFGLVALEGLAADLHVVVARTCGVAADIAAWRQVYVCEPTIGGLADALVSSRRDWTAPQRACMEQFSVERLSRSVTTACARAIQIHNLQALPPP